MGGPWVEGEGWNRRGWKVLHHVGLSRPVEIGSPVIPRFYVGRKTHPSYVESTI